MSEDPQDAAEQVDEDVLGADALDDESVTSDEAPAQVPADEPMGLPFADADVTDESISDRHEREEPEVWEQPIRGYDDDRGSNPYADDAAADERLEQIVELGPERATTSRGDD